VSKRNKILLMNTKIHTTNVVCGKMAAPASAVTGEHDAQYLSRRGVTGKGFRMHCFAETDIRDTVNGLYFSSFDPVLGEYFFVAGGMYEYFTLFGLRAASETFNQLKRLVDDDHDRKMSRFSTSLHACRP
jgi:hypothetical protein